MQGRQKCGKRSQTLWMQGQVDKKKIGRANQRRVEKVCSTAKLEAAVNKKSLNQTAGGPALPAPSEVTRKIIELHTVYKVIIFFSTGLYSNPQKQKNKKNNNNNKQSEHCLQYIMNSDRYILVLNSSNVSTM